MDLASNFVLTWLVCYAASVAVMFAVALAVLWMNARHPEKKIQTRPQTHAARKDILSSLRQLAVTSTCLAVGIWAQRNGFTPAPITAWWAMPLFLLLSLVLHDAWFYWGHRALHTRALYRFHRPHHQTVTPSVWSNDAGSSVDTFFAHSYYALVLFVVPMPLLVLVAHRLFDQVSAIIGHSGYEYFASRTSRAPFPMICTTYHDQHHSEFVWNYANYFSFWDRWCGTIHPHYDRIVEGWEETGARPPMPRAHEKADA